MMTSSGTSAKAAPPRALCTFSGGYDSTAALIWSLERFPTEALFVDYGQRYLMQEYKALDYVVQTPRFYRHPHWLGTRVVKAQLQLMPFGVRWIPYRNLVIASLATNVAAVTKSNVIVFGSKSAVYRPEDPISYKDSTVGFYRDLERLINESTEPQNQPSPAFMLPCVGWGKELVLRYLRDRGVDLRQLWNCYREDGRETPCGTCEHCLITQPLIEKVLTEVHA